MANHWSECEDSLNEIIEHSEKYIGMDWQNYIVDFCRISPRARAEELVAWDRKLAEETTPNRSTANLIAKRLELGGWHDRLRKAGR